MDFRRETLIANGKDATGEARVLGGKIGPRTVLPAAYHYNWEQKRGKFGRKLNDYELRLMVNMDFRRETLRGGITKKLFFFFGKTPKGGGGRDLAESKISLSEKTEIFFFKRGGGLTYSKRVLS